MTIYGVIIGQALPSTYEFSIADPNVRPVKYEYVQIDLEEQTPKGLLNVQVLGQVKSLYSLHPFYDQRTSPSAVWNVHLSDQRLDQVSLPSLCGAALTFHSYSEVPFSWTRSMLVSSVRSLSVMSGSTLVYLNS